MKNINDDIMGDRELLRQKPKHNGWLLWIGISFTYAMTILIHKFEMRQSDIILCEMLRKNLQVTYVIPTFQSQCGLGYWGCSTRFHILSYNIF